MLSHKHICMAAAASLVLAAGLSSCLDTDDGDSFQVSVSGYVIQDYKADSTRIFAPYFTVASNLSTEPLQTVTFKGLNNSIAMTKVSDYIFENNPDNYWTSNLSDINGTYTVTATSTNNAVSTSSVNVAVANADTLGRIRMKEFKYDGTNVSVKLHKVHNASAYGVTVLPFNKTASPKRVDTYFLVSTYTTIEKEDNDTIMVYSKTFRPSDLGSDSAYIRAYVVGSTGLFQQSDTVIRMAKE